MDPVLRKSKRVSRLLPRRPVCTNLAGQGNLAYFSGHLPVDGQLFDHRKSRVGLDGGARLRSCPPSGAQYFGNGKRGSGGLDRVERVVKILGMVNAAFGLQHPQVINGCSELFGRFGVRIME